MAKQLFSQIGSMALATGVALAGLNGPVAHAQAEPADTQGSAAAQPGDIVVTALKRRTTAETTPLAITAVTGDQLRAANIVDSDALQRISPGLVIRESPFSGSRLSIRNIRSASEPTVGLYYDETPVVGSAGVGSDAGGTTPNIRPFDVDRVEVLRGPQGTLYGSSSEAGTIRVIFNKPDTTRANLAVDGKMFGVDGGQLGFETQGMANLPLIKDKLAVRAVAYYQDLPGYIDNIKLNQNDVNKSLSKGGRAEIRATPAEGLTIDGLAVVQDTHGHLNDYDLNAGVYKQDYESQQPSKDHFEIYSGTLNYEVGPVVLTGVGSHAYRKFDYAYDTSAFDRLIAARYPAGSPPNAGFTALAPSVAESPQVTKTDTAEARVATRGTGPLQLTGGFYYSDRNGNFISNIRRTSPTGGALLLLSTATLEGQRIIQDELKQTAEFAEGTYDLTSRLSVTGGVRHYYYKRQVYGLVTVPNAFLSLTAGPATNITTSESGWLYKGTVDYKFSPHVLAYATASSGERPGGVNQTLGLPAALQTYGSDHVHNYELGLKTTPTRALVFNVDIFQIDWDGIQTSGTLPTTPFIFIANASTARARGVEADAAYHMGGWTAGVSGSYIDAHLTADQTSPGLVAPGKNGDQIPAAPKVTLQPNLQYAAPLSSTLKATLRADGYLQSSSWVSFPHTSALYERLPPYATLSLRAGLGGVEDDWNISVYANNVTNNNAAVDKFDNASLVFGNQPRTISLTPRTVGFEFFKHF